MKKHLTVINTKDVIRDASHEVATAFGHVPAVLTWDLGCEEGRAFIDTMTSAMDRTGLTAHDLVVEANLPEVVMDWLPEGYRG